MTVFQLDDVGFTLHAPEDHPLVLDIINDDFALWPRYPSDKGPAVGVIDIKRLVVETPEQIARGKLAAMTKAAEQLRGESGSRSELG